MVSITPGQLLAILARRSGLTLPWHYAAQQEAVLLAIRLPRVLLGGLIGAGLATAGAAMQGLFRNPLADPGLVGVASGAALAVVAVIVLGATVCTGVTRLLGPFTLQAAAFGGGVVTTLVVYWLASLSGRTVVATMLLAGIAVNALTGAGIGLLTFVATDAQLRNITFWSLGSLSGATWTAVGAVLPCIVPAVVCLLGLARALNVLLLGESEAGHLGIDLERVKRLVVLCVALAVGAAVSVAGIIGFIGLVVPHLLRLAIGPDHRYLLPGSALLGASLLLGADLVARTLSAPAELPIGIVTAALGAPFFLWLLLRHRQPWGL
jgi:iron complex transport system permease protein